MNTYCKDRLKHSWGKSPERKKLEQQYNLNYYQRNRDKILTRAKMRNQTRSAADHDIGVAPLYLYEDTADFMNYSNKAFKAIKNILKKPIKVVKNFPEYVKKGKKAVQNIYIAMQTPLTAIKNTKLVKAIKNVFGKFKYYWNSATI